MNTLIRSAALDAWLKALRDLKGRARIVSRLEAMERGNFGDCESVGEGVSEMRIHCGPGYRVYFTRRGRTIYVLLTGGDKSTQQRDIKAALEIARAGGLNMAKAKFAPFDAADYLDDAEVIAEYLTAALEDPDPEVFLRAVANVARAHGIGKVAQDSGLGRESLYKALAPGAKPRYETIRKLMDALGVKLAVTAN